MFILKQTDQSLPHISGLGMSDTLTSCTSPNHAVKYMCFDAYCRVCIDKALTAVLMKTEVLWDMTPSSLVKL